MGAGSAQARRMEDMALRCMPWYEGASTTCSVLGQDAVTGVLEELAWCQ